MRGLRLSACAVLLILVASSPAATQDNSSETYRQLNLFGDVFERVRADYVEEVSDKELIEAAINGMLTSLDPHSSFLNEEAMRDMDVQTRGEFGGLGIEVTMEGGLVKVVSPIDDTPAFRAGIQAGDYITHLDGEGVLGLTLNEAVEKMRGPIDTEITLTIRREGEEPFDVVIVRDVIRIRSVRGRVEGDIGYIRITSFNQQTDEGLRDRIAEIEEELDGAVIGYVLDLRNNPGGLLDQAIAVADTFLEQGEIVSTRGREKDDVSRFNAKAGDLTHGLPLVVLINGGSASASEIVAGALQDHRRALLLGTKSFGKGSVQTIIPMAGNTAMRLTTQRYYTPSGRSIQAKGIEPDIQVEQAKIETIAAPTGRSEADLRGALDSGIESDTDQGADPAPDTEAAPSEDGEAMPEGGEEIAAEEAPQDYQLSRAFDLLRGIHLFSGRGATQ